MQPCKESVLPDLLYQLKVSLHKYENLSLAGIEGSNPTGILYLSLVIVVCCQVEVTAKGRSLIQRSPTE